MSSFLDLSLIELFFLVFESFDYSLSTLFYSSYKSSWWCFEVLNFEKNLWWSWFSLLIIDILSSFVFLLLNILMLTLSFYLHIGAKLSIIAATFSWFEVSFIFIMNLSSLLWSFSTLLNWISRSELTIECLTAHGFMMVFSFRSYNMLLMLLLICSIISSAADIDPEC